VEDSLQQLTYHFPLLRIVDLESLSHAPGCCALPGVLWRSGAPSGMLPRLHLLGLPALTEITWDQLRPLLPPQKPQTGRPSVDHRLVVEGMLWIISTGSSWRELPERFGPWQTIASCYSRWCREGLWARILLVLLPFDASFRSSA
jgi:transposase